MTPLLRSDNIERSVNLLTKHFRLVLIDAEYWINTPIRLRADKLHASVYFAKSESQVDQWQNNGGVMLRWLRRYPVGPSDAVFFAECPRSIALLDQGARDTRWLSVVYIPPTWRPHYDAVKSREKPRAQHLLRAMADGFERMKFMAEDAPPLTSSNLEKILRFHRGQIVQPSSSLESPADAARSAGTTSEAP